MRIRHSMLVACDNCFRIMDRTEYSEVVKTKKGYKQFCKRCL